MVLSAAAGKGLESMGVPADRIVHIHNPIEAVSRKPVRAAILGVRPGAFVLMFAGRITWDKNLEQVIKALPDVPVRVMLVIVGDGVEQKNLQALAVRLGVADRVIFTGKVDYERVGSYYAVADVLVLPSRILESFSRMVIEGMVLGKPAIVSDRGGNPEAIEDGVRGFVVPPHDVAMMAARVRRLEADKTLVARMGKNARTWAQRELSSHVIGRKIIAMYAAALE